MRNKWAYIILFALAICGAVVLSFPSFWTLVEMSRDDGNTARTLELLDQRFRKSPGNLELGLELVDASLEAGNTDEALLVLHEVHRHHPDEIRVQRGIASLLVERNDVDGAFAVLPSARRDRDFHLRLMEFYRRTGDLLRAEDALLLAEGENTRNPEVWLTIAGWRTDLYDMSGAGEALRRALAADGDGADVWERYFDNRAWQLDGMEVVRAAQELDALRPLDRTRLKVLLEFQLALRDVDGVASTAGKIRDLADASSREALNYATMLQRSGRTAESDAVLMDVAFDAGTDPQDRSEAMVLLRDSIAARKDLALALRLAFIDADPASARENRLLAAEMAVEAGRLDDAERAIGDMADMPDAPAEVLRVDLLLAYSKSDYQAMPDLFGRMRGIDASVDDALYFILDNDCEVGHWRGAVQQSPASVPALVGLARAASQEDLPAEAGAAVDTVLPLLDNRDAVGAFGAFDALLYLAGKSGEHTARDRRMRQALELSDRYAGGPLGESLGFMLMAADANKRSGRADKAEELWSRVVALHPDDPWSWLGLARSAAARGDDGNMDRILKHMMERPGRREASEIRGLAQACLGLSEFYQEGEPDKAHQWLSRARKLVDDNRDILPLVNVENLYLMAEISERSEEWNLAMAYWLEAAEADPDSVPAALGTSRAALGMEDYDFAWRALERAESLVPEVDQERRLQLMWQYFAVADVTPEIGGQREARQKLALSLAERHLSRQWNDTLAESMIWRELDAGRLERANALLARFREVPPDLYAPLAEAYLVRDMKDKARETALAAASSPDVGVTLRMAYVLAQTGEPQRAKTLLERVAGSGGRETPEFLLDLADTYGAVEDFPRQYYYTEKRARLGGEAEWQDAIDRHAWNGDWEGALRLLDEAEALFPSSVPVLDRKLRVLADSNRPGRVVDAYLRARDRIAGIESGLSADALAALGVSYDDVRENERARRFFRLSLEKEAVNKRASMGLARLLRRDGNLSGALLWLRQYVDVHGDDAWGWLELANTRTAALQNGRSEYRKVLELTVPGAEGEILRDVRAARAVALRQLGREKEALALFENILGPAIDNPDIACDYAEMLMEIGSYDEAERILRDTIKVFPAHVWAYRLESTILVRRKKFDQAVARLREALLWAPNDGEVQRDLGFAAQMWERMWPSQKAWLRSGGR